MATRLPDPQPPQTLASRPDLIPTATPRSCPKCQSELAEIRYQDKLLDYISAAKQAGFRVVGYYFQSSIEDCKLRNERRAIEQRIPLPGLLGTYSKLELPSIDEGFDQLFYVRITEDGFVVEEWKNEV